MDVAGVIIGSIALVLASFSSLVAGFQLQHYIRFRRPVFTVRKAELSVSMHGGFTVIGPGHIALNIRGARYPITLTKWDIMLFRGRSTGGWGADGISITLEPEVWTPVPIQFEVGVGVDEDLPASFEVEIYFSNPRDLFIVPLILKLADDRSKYSLDDEGAWARYVDRTISRRKRRLRRLVSALGRKLAPRR